VTQEKSANDNLIDRTIEVWQPRLRRNVSPDEARQIARNVTGFFSILAEWSEQPEAANDQGKLANGTPVETYLASSGLHLRPSLTLRFHAGLKHPIPVNGIREPCPSRTAVYNTATDQASSINGNSNLTGKLP
jgi:hypothetical protein